MKQRGRPNQFLNVVPAAELEPPEPPIFLTDDQAEVWREVTTSLPPDWFRPEQLPLLEQYCRHVSRAREIAQVLKVTKPTSRNYFDLCRQEMEQSRAISMLATKMRITQQSTYDKSKRKPELAANSLWTDEDDE